MLTKIFVFIKKINSFGKKGKNKLKNFISKKNKEAEVIKNAINIVETHSFECIKGLKPNDVKFVNQSNLNNQEENENKIKTFLDEKINEKYDTESNWSLDTSISNISLFENDEDNFIEEELDAMFEDIQKMAENQ